MDKENKNQKKHQLTNLVQLHKSVNDIQRKQDFQITSLHNNLSHLLANVSLSDLEERVSKFIEDEAVSSGLFLKVSSTNANVLQKLSEIKFFGTNKSYMTGFLSSDFSEEDKEKWIEIESSLEKIYDSEFGLIRQVQDHFLFQVTSNDLAKLLSKNSLSLTEELFIRTILIKCYLTNFRQLILPFYEINDKLLIKFKKDYISKLTEQRDVEPDNSQIAEEINLLSSQITLLESKAFLESNENLHNKIIITNKNMSAFNVKLNTGSVILGSTETARYFTSFVGHSSGSGFLKSVGNFGLKSSSFFAHCLPFVSAITEAGTQMNNNYVVYDYEKKLKAISVIENVKRNLLILEQQITNHYFDNLLSRLQKNILESHNKTSELIDVHYQNYLIEKDRRFDFDKVIEKVELEHHQAISKVELEKNRSILEKEMRISELDIELSHLQNEIDSTKRNLVRITKEKQREEERLNRSIAAVNEDLKLTKDLFECEKESIRLREKNADQVIKNTLSGDLKAALSLEFSKNKELGLTINILLKKQDHLEEEITILRSNLSSLQEELKDEKDSNQAIIEKLRCQISISKRDLVSKSKVIIDLEEKQIHSSWIEKDYSEKLTKISQYEKELSDYYGIAAENHKLTSDYNALKENIGFKDSLLSDRKEKIVNLTKRVAEVQNDFRSFREVNNRPYFNLQGLPFSVIIKVCLITFISIFSLRTFIFSIFSILKFYRKIQMKEKNLKNLD
ncbi:MAG TPA: hypothetical protein VN854_00045 [Mycoplasmatales bacterium]|nr:hypothetical protein [Mycoplasmatales bacterium]